MRKIVRVQEITVETRSVTIIRTNRESSGITCDACQEPVSAFDSSEIAAALQLSTTEIEGVILSGGIHATNPGSQQICGNSVAEFLMKKKL